MNIARGWAENWENTSEPRLPDCPEDRVIIIPVPVEIINAGIYSSYEPCIYPGVNIKYFINTNNWDGICCCENRCDGKGRADGDGDCKKVTIAVFKSGKIIITGAQNTDQLETAYYFITEFINERKEVIQMY